MNTNFISEQKTSLESRRDNICSQFLEINSLLEILNNESKIEVWSYSFDDGEEIHFSEVFKELTLTNYNKWMRLIDRLTQEGDYDSLIENYVEDTWEENFEDYLVTNGGWDSINPSDYCDFGDFVSDCINSSHCEDYEFEDLKMDYRNEVTKEDIVSRILENLR